MSRAHIKSPYIRKMTAEELLAIRKFRKRANPDPLIVYWMICQTDAIYHRIDLRVRSGELEVKQ